MEKTKTKKTGRIILISVAGVLVILAVLYGLQLRKEKIKPKEPVPLSSGALGLAQGEVYLTAHRGFSAIAPENSVPAMLEAGKAGFFAAEFDIFETSDSRWVVMHDDTLRRTTNGFGKIRKYTAEKLAGYRIDNGANIADYPDLKIPTLEEVLDACAQYGIVPQIEIKDGSAAGIANLIAILKERGLLDKAIIISFNYELLNEVQKNAPGVEIWFLVAELNDDNLALCMQKPEYRVAFNANAKENTPERIAVYRDAGLDFACYTVDDIAVLERLYREEGIRYFTTNAIIPA